MSSNSSFIQSGSVSDLHISVLVSAGIHPASGRARRSQLDARAVELGLGLAGTGLNLLHAGDPANPCLREYLGMGLPSMQVLAVEPSQDPLPALLWQLEQQCPQILLAGCAAEQGEASGLLPYLVAKKLGWPLVNNIAGIRSVENGYAELLQALPRGQRRVVRVRLPFVATVDKAAPAPRQSAFAVARRGQLDVLGIPSEVVSKCAAVADSVDIQPARKRPRRLAAAMDSGPKSAADRFKAATAKQASSGNTVMNNQPVSEQAQAIFKLLLEEGVVR